MIAFAGMPVPPFSMMSLTSFKATKLQLMSAVSSSWTIIILLVTLYLTTGSMLFARYPPMLFARHPWCPHTYLQYVGTRELTVRWSTGLVLRALDPPQ